MDLMALGYLLLAMATVCYLVSGIGVIRVMSRPNQTAPKYLRTLAIVGFALHLVGFSIEFFATDVIRFGFGLAVSGMLLIAVLINVLESYVHRITTLMGLVTLVAAVGTALPVIFPGNPIPSEDWTVLFRIHLIAALAAYSFTTIAVVQALLLVKLDRELKNPLKNPSQIGILSNMPDLMAMERILFRIVSCAFACLTLVLVLGAMTTLQTHQTLWMMDHKSIVTLLAWGIFGVLLFGRYVLGWRKKKALAWFWVGVVTFAVAYLGYRFILESFF